jgi:hypothetical protein
MAVIPVVLVLTGAVAIVPLGVLSTAVAVRCIWATAAAVACWMALAHVSTEVEPESLITIIHPVGWMMTEVLVVVVIVLVPVIVGGPVVSNVWVLVVGVVTVVEVVVVVVLTALATEPLVTDAVSTLVLVCVLDTADTLVCAGASAAVTAGVTAVVANGLSTSEVVIALLATPELVALTSTIGVLGGVCNAVLAVVLCWASAAIAELVALSAPDVTSWSCEVVIAFASGISPMGVPSAADALAGGRSPAAITRVVTWAVVLSPSAH